MCAFRPVTLDDTPFHTSAKRSRCGQLRVDKEPAIGLRPVTLDGRLTPCIASSSSSQFVIPVEFQKSEKWTSHLSVRGDGRRYAIDAIGEEPSSESAVGSWWIAKALTLPARQRSGWVVAQMIHEVTRPRNWTIDLPKLGTF